jgi:two-component system capsular synthesis response regulator RcsB
LLRSALKKGAKALISKESAASELTLALHAVRKGRSYVDKGLQAMLSPHAALQRTPNSLTLAEMEVLRLFAYEGLSVQQIAARLHRSYKTISRHKRSAQAKLGLKTNQELLDYCRQAYLHLSVAGYIAAPHGPGRGEGGQIEINRPIR